MQAHVQWCRVALTSLLSGRSQPPLTVDLSLRNRLAPVRCTLQGSTYGPLNVGICSAGTYQGACSAQKMLACGRISGSESKSPLCTTQNFWLRLSFGKTDPQCRQKQRVNPGLSLASTKRSIRSAPRVHETESSGKPKFATWTDPDDF